MVCNIQNVTKLADLGIKGMGYSYCSEAVADRRAAPGSRPAWTS